MNGKVNADLEAVVMLDVHGKKGKIRRIKAIVDTGYNGLLTLPLSLIKSLGLTRIARSEGEMADGRIVYFDVFRGRVTWQEQLRWIEIDEAETTPLVGMELLEHHKLEVHVRKGGDVKITQAKR